MSRFAEVLARATANPGDTSALILLAETALDEGEEERAVEPVAAAAARAGSNAQLWHLSALLHGALHRYDAALPAFERAAALEPANPAIAHARAKATLEAGLDAVALFGVVRRLNPNDGSVLIGEAAARFAMGDGAKAVAELDAILERAGGWAEGHAGVSRMRYMLGEQATATISIERALAKYPRDFNLWRSLISTLNQAERFEEAREAIRRGRAAVGGNEYFDLNEAIVLSETGDAAGAEALLTKLDRFDDISVAVRQVRHFLRTGQLDRALPLIERWMARAEAPRMRFYASIAWRMAGDPRWQWLEGDPRLVSVVDLTDKLPPLDRLAEVLRGLHAATGQPLDQSVRGGTQTDGVLFARISPEIRQVRAAVVDAVTAHIAQLPPADPAHPTLGLRRDRPVRFAGAWSVRLTDGGNHINHVHPFGWLSSALYVALPEGEAGVLKLGEPPERLGLDLPPVRTIEPRPGQLVLFPSTMWHGTAPFGAGERLTIAFDVAPPR